MDRSIEAIKDNWWKLNPSLSANGKCIPTSVTRLGDLLDFGQLFKTFGNYYFFQISHILR